MIPVYKTMSSAELENATTLKEAPTGTQEAWLQAIGGDVMFTLTDGDPDPSTDDGQRIYDGHPPMLISSSEGVHGCKVVRASATSTLRIHYFRRDDGT